MPTIDLTNEQQRRFEVAQILALYRDLAPADQVTLVMLVLAMVDAKQRAQPATVQ